MMRMHEGVGNSAISQLLSTSQPSSLEVTVAPVVQRTSENVEHSAEHFSIGAQHFQAGRYRQAAQSFERARQTPGLTTDTHGAILYDLALCNMRLERWATAVMYLEQYLSISGADREAGEAQLELARAGTSGDASDISEREGIPAEAADADPGSQIAHLRQIWEAAGAQFVAGRFRQSIILFEKARQLSDGQFESEAVYNIGKANLRLRRFSTAIIYFEQAHDLATSDEDRADVHELLNEARRSAGALTGQEQAQMMYGLAQEAHSAGDYEAALRRFRELLSVRGVAPDILNVTYYNLASLYLQLGQSEQARHYIDLYLAASPDDADGLELRRRIEAESGSEPETAN